MEDTVDDVSYQTIIDISEVNPTKIQVFFTKERNYPSIEQDIVTTYWMPLPREVNNMWVFEGAVFSDYHKNFKTIWNQYLVSVYHLAGHARVSDFEMYKKWLDRKSPEIAYPVMEYIEDIRVDEFLKNNFPEYWEPTESVKKFYDKYFESKKQKDKQQASRQRFGKLFDKDITVKSEKIQNKIRQIKKKNSEELLKIADYLYSHPKLLNVNPYPFTDIHNRPEKVKEYLKNPVLNPTGIAQSSVSYMNELWELEINRQHKTQKKYDKLSEGLHFDNIGYAPENIGDYLKLKNDTNLFLRKLTSQIKMMPNVQDNAMPEDMGVLDMQRAIQAIASQNESIQMFEQDDQRRQEEEWAIVLDTSSSMKFKFEEIKSLALCLAEASQELNSKTGKWGLYCVNDKFNIVKDHGEQYSQKPKSRVGGIEMGGLSFLPDGITLVARLLTESQVEKKNMFVITDGQAMGYDGVDKQLEEAVVNARKQGIKIVGVGVPKSMSKLFTITMPLEDMRKTMAKFVRAYRAISEDDL